MISNIFFQISGIINIYLVIEADVVDVTAKSKAVWKSLQGVLIFLVLVIF